jgi:hypothetical protein
MPPKKYGTIEEGSLRVSLGIGSLFRDDLHLVDLAQTKANKTIWVVYKVDISTSDTTQTTLNVEEVHSTMLSLISTDDLDCLDIRGLSLFRVTKRLHDTAGKGCKKSENRNVAVPIKKLETFTIGEEYFFVLVDNRSKSSSSSVVGGSETSNKRIIQVAVSQIVGIQTQKLRLGSKLSAEFDHFKFDSPDPAKRVAAMSAVVVKASDGVDQDAEFMLNPSVIVAVRLILHRVNCLDMTDLPTKARKRRSHEMYAETGAQVDNLIDEAAASAMESVAMQPIQSSTVVCDNPDCRLIFVNPKAKFCRKCRTEKLRDISCRQCNAVCVFTPDLFWCDFCGGEVFDATMRVSDEGVERGAV